MNAAQCEPLCPVPIYSFKVEPERKTGKQWSNIHRPSAHDSQQQLLSYCSHSHFKYLATTRSRSVDDWKLTADAPD